MAILKATCMKTLITAVLIGLPSLALCAEPVEKNSTDSIPAFASLCSIDIPADSYTLDPCFTIPGLGLFTKVGDGRFRSLDAELSPDMAEFMRLDNIYYDQVVGLTDVMLVRSGSDIYSLSDDCTCIGRFDTNSFRIFPGQTGSYYAVEYHADGSTLYSMPLSSDTKACALAKSKEYISRVIPVKDSACLFASGTSIYLCQNGEIAPYLTVDNPITDFALTNSDILVATANHLLAIGDNEVSVVGQGEARSLLYDNGRAYVVNHDGSILYSDNF
jgi:hypothetical protein